VDAMCPLPSLRPALCHAPANTTSGVLARRPAGKLDENTKENMVRAFYPYHPRTDKLIAARNWWVAGCGSGPRTLIGRRLSPSAWLRPVLACSHLPAGSVLCCAVHSLCMHAGPCSAMQV
jgi:hypothetical protein